MFLGASGLLALPASSAAAPAGSPSDRLTLGVIGVGSRAQQVMDDLILEGGVEFVSVSDAYDGRLERAVERTEGRAKIVRDYREMLEDDSIEAVLIATPDHWHARQAIQALAAGKHVYCEKPLSYTPEEGLAIARAVERSGKKLQVGSQPMSSTLNQKAREIVESGELGQITMIRANSQRNSPSGAWLYPIPPDADEETVDWEMFQGSAPPHEFSLDRFFRWRCYEDYSGGIATDLFVHLCTVVQHVMGAGAAAEVLAMGDLYRWKESREVPDTLNALLRYREGFTVNLSATFNNNTSASSSFEILGTEGSLTVGYTRMYQRKEVVRDGNGWIVNAWPAEFEEAYLAELAKKPKPGRRPEPTEFRAGRTSATRLHWRRFVEAIREDKPTAQDVWAGHNAAGCAHMINRAAKTGRTVRWDFERRTIAG